MPKRNIIVAGASAGGVDAFKELREIIAGLLEGICFYCTSYTLIYQELSAGILSKETSLPVTHPSDGEKIEQGHIYVAVPDHHLLIEDEKIGIKKGPKENRFRPSIDALFRSAAYLYESRVIGVILSGALDDGSSGLWSIKRLGGIAIVQEPAEAAFPEMPLNAMQYVDADHVLPVSDMGRLLKKLTAENASSAGKKMSQQEKKLLQMEVTIAANDNAFELGILKQGELTPFTCPECHGVLVKLIKGNMMEFRCHTGHSFTASALLAGITEVTEETLTQSMRSAEESTMLMETIGKHFNKSGENKIGDIFLRKAKASAKKARVIHKLILEEESISLDMQYKK